MRDTNLKSRILVQSVDPGHFREILTTYLCGITSHPQNCDIRYNTTPAANTVSNLKVSLRACSTRVNPEGRYLNHFRSCGVSIGTRYSLPPTINVWLPWTLLAKSACCLFYLASRAKPSQVICAKPRGSGRKSGAEEKPTRQRLLLLGWRCGQLPRQFQKLVSTYSVSHNKVQIALIWLRQVMLGRSGSKSARPWRWTVVLSSHYTSSS